MAKVFLSAGHGGSDPGAVGNGLKEKDLNLWIMSACSAFLVSAGVEVVCSRIRDENDPVAEEVREANASDADIAISFHNNGGGGDGSETWYYTHSAESQLLAKLMEEASQQLGQNSRGFKATTTLYFLNKTKMPAALVETAFIDNTTDIQIVNTKEKAHAFGIAYATAICKYLNISYNVKEKVNQKYIIKVKCDLNIRADAGIEYPIVGCIKGEDAKYKYTIVAKKYAADGGIWGLLKSGAGWINISEKYVTYFKEV